MEQLDKALENLKAAILSRSPKTQGILVEWIHKWAALLRNEKTFPRNRLPNLPYYKRGDVIRVEFGFNVGVEFGGIHYAVVVEENNNKKSEHVVVVPLTSRTSGKAVFKNDVLLGNVINDVATVAKPNQIRVISKMRIKRKKIARLSGKQLQLIDDQLKEILRLELDKQTELV